MNTFRKIAFGYSTRCNIRCEHCVAADDGPENEKMDISKAKTIIQEMAYANVKGISFTAGEPLLSRDDIISLIQLCKKNEIYSRVVTNGFWAKNQQQADDIVSALKVAGLSQLRISCSRWHQKQIPHANIVLAAASCRKMGLDYFISFVTDFSEQDDACEQVLIDNHLKYFPEPLIYFGRASRLSRPQVSTDYPPNRCAMNPYLSPELDMIACCDAGNRFTKTDFLYLGNLKRDSIENLFQRYENNHLYYLVKTVGLSNLASSIGLKASEIVTHRKCELCEKLFNSENNLSLLTQCLRSDPDRWRR